jgi:hypothetical protein
MLSSGMLSRVALVRTEVSVFLRCDFRLLVTANVVRSSMILCTLMMGAILSSEMSVLTKATGRHSPEIGIFQLRLLLCFLSA